MTDDELADFRRWAKSFAEGGFWQAKRAVLLLAELDRLRLELAGERKANALLNAGMGSVCEGRDELKHRCRELERERDLARKAAGDMAERVAAQAELLARRAERSETVPCPGHPDPRRTDPA